MALPLPGEIIDLGKLFQRVFGGKPYVINKNGDVTDAPGELYQIPANSLVIKNGQQLTPKGSLVAEKYKGVEIWLPTYLSANGVTVFLPYSIIKITGKKTIIRTPLVERMGTVKEQYNIDDYSIIIKGFLISDDRTFPEDDLKTLKILYETQTAVTIDNALTNIFLANPALDQFEQRRVVITSLDIPEVQGGRKNVRPFVMEMESDSVFTLELNN